MSQTRAFWSADKLLKPWRRGRLDFPFITSERTPEQQRARVLAIVFGTGAFIAVLIFGVLVASGVVPEIWRDPKVTQTHENPFFPYIVALVAGAIGSAVLAVVLFPMADAGGTALGHPWTITATDETLTITETAGETFQGRWEEWELDGYDQTMVARGAPAIMSVWLRLRDRVFVVSLMRIRHPRKLLKAVARKLASI